MPAKKYIVALTSEERQTLKKLISTGKAAAYKINRARILLKADINQDVGGWADQVISEALDISVATIERVRKQLVEEGFEAVLNYKQRKRNKPRSLDGKKEAHLIAIIREAGASNACSEAPEGKARWTLRLLSDRMVELGYVEQISHETIRQTLKKTNLSLG